MIIPERTIDIWTALEVERCFPGSLIWAPTTNQQGRDERWDLEVRTPKLFVVESKSLGDRGSVIGTEQLAFMCALEAAFKSVTNHPVVFYGLPLGKGCPSRASRRPLLRHSYQKQFPQYQMMIVPSAVWAMSPGLHKRKRFMAKSSMLPRGSASLQQMLKTLGDCTVGWSMTESEQPLGAIIDAAISSTFSYLADMTEDSRQARDIDPGGLPAPTFGFVSMPNPRTDEIEATVESGNRP